MTDWQRWIQARVFEAAARLAGLPTALYVRADRSFLFDPLDPGSPTVPTQFGFTRGDSNVRRVASDVFDAAFAGLYGRPQLRIVAADYRIDPIGDFAAKIAERIDEGLAQWVLDSIALAAKLAPADVRPTDRILAATSTSRTVFVYRGEKQIADRAAAQDFELSDGVAGALRTVKTFGAARDNVLPLVQALLERRLIQ
jgi:hypothetical protein